jgi:hypothetical protein
MKSHEFSILHELKGTQILIDTDYDHDQEKYNLSFKFWSNKMNGYAKIIMSWTADKEKDFKNTFDKFKDLSESEKWYKKFNS